MARRPAHLSHLPTPQQQAQMLLPIHACLIVLPLGQFTTQHAHDLAAFLNVAQSMGVIMQNREMIRVGAHAADIVIAMKARVDAGEPWRVTDSERDELMACISTLDTWMKQRNVGHWRAAMQRTRALLDRAAAKGAKDFQPIPVA